ADLVRVAEVDRLVEVGEQEAVNTFYQVRYIAEAARLRAVAVDSDRLAAEGLAHEGGQDAAVVGAHLRAIGVVAAYTLAGHEVFTTGHRKIVDVARENTAANLLHARPNEVADPASVQGLLHSFVPAQDVEVVERTDGEPVEGEPACAVLLFEGRLVAAEGSHDAETQQQIVQVECQLFTGGVKDQLIAELLAAVGAVAAAEAFEEMLDAGQRQLQDPRRNAPLAQAEQPTEDMVQDLGMNVHRRTATRLRFHISHVNLELFFQDGL